ncbi:heme o synthase [Malassezia cuniculi]|uniref:Heme o synthase n=1 Tax=Malassezia cuniculi TaxID=948313 RepID=A0AAF0EUS8_9BASI|nr:heme o synthase [Malassezia cuniculi]
MLRRLVARVPSAARSLSTRALGYSLSVPSSDARIHVGSTGIVLEAPTAGVTQPFVFDYVWLRDACRSAESVHPSTQQKLFHTTDVPLAAPGDSLLHASEQPVRIAGSADAPELLIDYSPKHAVVNEFTRTISPEAVKVADAPHTARIPLSLLFDHAVAKRYAASHCDVLSVAEPWDAATLKENGRPLSISWPEVKTPQGLLALLTAALRDGFAFVTELPTEKTSSEPGPDAASLRELATTIGTLRHTLYGTLWNVQSIAESRNIAYTNLDLGFHMDLLYFQNPPRFQLLHMLRKTVSGGQNLFVDSMKIAEIMWEHHRDEWEALAETPVAYHYVNAGEHYYYTHPVFEVAAPAEGHAGPSLRGTMPRLAAINYSPPFQAPLPLQSPALRDPARRELFLRAFNRFARLTHDRGMIFERALEPGECVLFDNRRVLHSRTGFEWNESEKGHIGRWLKGAYVEGDSVWSRYRALRNAQ